MLEKVSTILIVTSLILLSVAADWMIQTGIRNDVSALRANVIAVR
ncbi:hypothetical protein QA640_28740 [Bradyrhizobium sp. CB82]|nr:hypothetical protein [Bradyrhizobium sp. CB82]WFU38399.1 hypothetical protein QA640_28740 [Bradyrhizobium sp. CB82]